MNLESGLNDSRDVCEVRVTSRPFFTFFNTQNTGTEFASWRLQSWAKDVAMECNGWNLSWTKVWSNKKENETMSLKREGENIKSKKQTG